MKQLACIIFAAIMCCNAANIVRINDPFRENIGTHIGTMGCKMKEKVLICDCTESINKDVILEADSIPTETRKIAISDCEKVVFGTDTINNKRSLREISVDHVPNLILESFSIYRRTRSREESLSRS
ncbi:hypothetical protein Trydic_g1019 [Trypoxylus dichotomus]